MGLVASSPRLQRSLQGTRCLCSRASISPPSALLMLLAGPRAVRKNDQLSVMYAMDYSDSIHREVVDESIRYILETAGSKQEEDEVGLVLFGRDAAVELPPRSRFRSKPSTLNSLATARTSIRGSHSPPLSFLNQTQDASSSSAMAPRPRESSPAPSIS